MTGQATKGSLESHHVQVSRKDQVTDINARAYVKPGHRILMACIGGHESLRKAGFLHRDISINNLMINEDDNNISWLSFLIDLDLPVR